MKEEIEQLKKEIKVLERRVNATIRLTAKALSEGKPVSEQTLIASIYELADKDTPKG